LEIGKAMHDRGHRVTVVSLSNFSGLVEEYDLPHVPLDPRPVNAAQEATWSKFIKSDYSFRAFIKWSMDEDVHAANRDLFVKMKDALKGLLRKGQRFNILVADHNADPCYAIASMFNMKLVTTGRTLGKKGTSVAPKNQSHHIHIL
jgi:UDP:flavonoid glycosyltransferase YjiC (YdhE family)